METTPTFSDPTAPPEPQAGATPEANASLVHELRSYAHPSCFSRDEFAYAHQRAIEQVSALETALATSRAETEEARAKTKETAKDFEIAFRLVRRDYDALTARLLHCEEALEERDKEVLALTATLAQREAEAVELRIERDNAVGFASRVEKAEVLFKRVVDSQLQAISEMPLGKTINENLSDAVSRVLNERDTAIARVRELEDDGRRLDWLEAKGKLASAMFQREHCGGVEHWMQWLLLGPAYTSEERAKISIRAAIDNAAAARAAGTGEEGQ